MADTGARSIVLKLVPEPFMTIARAIRARRHSHWLNQQWGLDALTGRLLATLGGTVVAGPFAGLVLPSMAATEHLGPYLLGTYEHELCDFWRSLTPRSVPLVVNVGAKFGYYAVGLAKRLACPVVAFDPDPWARRATRETARLNGVADLVMHGACTRAALADLPAGALAVIDCDGCEVDLLRPPLPAGLVRATLVVELHDVVIRGSGARIRESLQLSHEVVEILQATTPPVVNTDLSFLPESEWARAAVEPRDEPQSWYVCRPKLP